MMKYKATRSIDPVEPSEVLTLGIAVVLAAVAAAGLAARYILQRL